MAHELIERNTQIATARERGDTFSCIAAAHGITKQRVEQVARRAGVSQHHRAHQAKLLGWWATGMSTTDIARATGTAYSSVRRTIERCGLKPNKRSLWDRLAKHFEFASGCWIWKGGQNGEGYGVLKTRPEGRSRFAHRLVYEELTGAIDDSLVIDHLCREKLCVNPTHLEEVTSAENSRRGVHTGRKNKANSAA